MTLDACRLLELPRIEDARGALTFLEGEPHLPFEIRRVFYLYDVPAGSGARRPRAQDLPAAPGGGGGGFHVTVDDGRARRRQRLDRPDFGLYVPPWTWREIDHFSPRAVCLVLASAPYDERDYLRSYAHFVAAARGAPDAPSPTEARRTTG